MTYVLLPALRLRLPALGLLALAFGFLPLITTAQEQLGLRLERYAGLYAAGLNPANAALSPNRWEVSLFSADLFAENSYAYLQHTSLPRALAHTDRIISVEQLSGEGAVPNDAIVANFFTEKRRMHGIAQTRVSGPAVLFQLGERHSLGFTTALRAMTSAYRVPRALNYPALRDRLVGETVQVQPFGLAALAWGEIGGYYGRRGETADGLTTAFGIAPKLLLGLEGGYARARDPFTYTRLPNDAVYFDDVTWDYALTTGRFDADNQRLRVNGLGAGVDLGYTWASAAEAENDHQWRAGVSVLDLGFVRFNRQAERHLLRQDSSSTVSPGDFPVTTNARNYLSNLSAAFLGDSARTYQDDHFMVGLPTALSLQFDYRLATNWYASAVVVQPVPLSRHSLRRPATLAVVPRFEQRWGMVSLPLVLDDWRSPRLGLAARLGPLYLGTDNLTSFFTRRRLTGGDFYIALKINAFSWGDGGSSRQKRGRIRCYDF